MYGLFLLILSSLVDIFANGNSGYAINTVSDAATKSANISCAAFTSNSTNDPSSNVTEYCIYPNLFSMNTKKCEAFKDVNCGGRREPKTPCEYPNSNCSYPKGGNVSLCTCEDNPDLNYDTCLELEDGVHVWTARRWSPFYITCTSHRTLATRCPGASVIYNFFENKCENVYEVVNKAYSMSLSLSIPESLFHLVSVRQTILTPKTSSDSFSDVFVMPTTRFEIHPTSSFKEPVDNEIYSTTKHSGMKSIIPTPSHFETAFVNSQVMPSRLSLQTEPFAKYSSDYSEIFFKTATADPTEKTDSSSTLNEMPTSIYEVKSKNTNHLATSERIKESSQEESYYLKKSSSMSVHRTTISPSLIKDLTSSSIVAALSVVPSFSTTTTILSKDLNITTTDFSLSQSKDIISNSLSEVAILDSSRTFSQLLSNDLLTKTSPLFTSSSTTSNSSLATFSGNSNTPTSKSLLSHSSVSSPSDAFNTLPGLVSLNNKLSSTIESMSVSSKTKYSVSNSITISPQSHEIRSGNIGISSTSSSSFVRDNLETYSPTVSFTNTLYISFLTSENTELSISYSNTNLMIDASLATDSLDSYSAYETEFSTLFPFSTETIYSTSLSNYHSQLSKSKKLSDISKQAFSSFQTSISNDMPGSMQQSTTANTQPVSFAISLSESVATATPYVDSIHLENNILLSAPFDTLSSAYAGITNDNSNQIYTTSFPPNHISKSENENTRSKDYVSEPESVTRLTYIGNSSKHSEYQSVLDTIVYTSFQSLLFKETQLHSTISTSLTEESSYSVNISLSPSAVSDFYTAASIISTRMSQLNLSSSTTPEYEITKDHRSNLTSSTILPSYGLSPSMNTKETLSLPLQSNKTNIELSPNSSLPTHPTLLTKNLEMGTDHMNVLQSSFAHITEISISPTKTDTNQESFDTVEIRSITNIDSSTPAQINKIHIETSTQTYPSLKASPTLNSLKSSTQTYPSLEASPTLSSLKTSTQTYPSLDASPTLSSLKTSTQTYPSLEASPTLSSLKTSTQTYPSLEASPTLNSLKTSTQTYQSLEASPTSSSLKTSTQTYPSSEASPTLSSLKTSTQTYPSSEASTTLSSLKTSVEETKASFKPSSELRSIESQAFQNSELSTKVSQTINTRSTSIRHSSTVSSESSSEIPTTKSFTRVEAEKSASTQDKDKIVNIGIGVGVGCGFILIIIILIVIVHLRNRVKRGRRDLTQIRLPPEFFMSRNL